MKDLPSNSRKVLVWCKDENGNLFWQIDSHDNNGWYEAECWGFEVLLWQELPDPPPQDTKEN